MNLNIYISTSNKYNHLVEPFQYLFNKFWSKDQKVNIIGYEEPKFKLEDNFNFISLGKQTTVEDWSKDTKKFIESIDDDYFIHALEDQFIIRKVNIGMIEKLEEFLSEDVGRIALETHVQTKPYIPVHKDENIFIIELEQFSEYRLSLCYSIWNKKYMLKNLENSNTPQDFEIKGNIHAKNDGYKILGTRNSHPIYCCHSVREGNFENLDFTVHDGYEISLHDDIINDMKEKRMI
tara:strand:- start:187 stop:891 length:705 start_codon:yes stop_codon:yes gene_type:complete